MAETEARGSWIEYDVIVRRNVMVPMRDGVKLATDPVPIREELDALLIRGNVGSPFVRSLSQRRWSVSNRSNQTLK